MEGDFEQKFLCLDTWWAPVIVKKRTLRLRFFDGEPEPKRPIHFDSFRFELKGPERGI